MTEEESSLRIGGDPDQTEGIRIEKGKEEDLSGAAMKFSEAGPSGKPAVEFHFDGKLGCWIDEEGPHWTNPPSKATETKYI